MNAGILRNHFITVKKPVLTKDEYGSDHKDWEVIYPSIRASIFNQTGSRLAGTMEVYNPYAYTCLIRRNFRRDLTEHCIITYEARDFRILSIENQRDGNNLILQLEMINE